MSHIVTCRICKEKFDTEKLNAEEWCMPTNRFYYHKSCWEDWAKKRQSKDIRLNETDDFWKDRLYRFLRFDAKVNIQEAKLFSQYERFRKQGYTAKGIYYASVYFYNVKHGDKDKAQGGIGIIPHVYSDAHEYWAKMEREQKGIMASIEQQIEERCKREEILVKKKKKGNKTKFNLEDIGD